MPNAYFNAQFERLQKLVLRSYLRCFEIGYTEALFKCNIEVLSSRRAACTIVSLVKYMMCAHYVLPEFFVFSRQLNLRRGGRGDTSRDLVLVRNYPGDTLPKTFSTFSPSFKKFFLYRAVYNYNAMRRIFDLDGYRFRDMRRVLSLFEFDNDGLVNL